jgi:hypothetical protein
MYQLGQCQASEEACADNMLMSYVRTADIEQGWVCF